MSTAPTSSDNLVTWLAYLERLHPRGIDLGLDRVGAVHRRLGTSVLAPVTIMVGGTNGKGSTVAFLSSMLRAAGFRVGSYTSPHLLRYNERVLLNGVEATDAALIAAFVQIEAVRAEDSLSYFEFGTLAAFLVLQQARLDVVILEVGLGGRLDAVNLIDANAAILTSVDLDHQEYLGNSRDRIGWDKAHIFRHETPAIVAALDAPQSVFDVARELGAQIHVIAPLPENDTGHWWCPLPDASVLALPQPQLAAPCQKRNACAALWAWWLLRDRLAFSPEAAAAGIASATLPGRLQRLPRTIETWVDVAHNAEAARTLADWLERREAANAVAIFAALADKDLASIVEPLRLCFSAWVVLDLRPMTPRAAVPETQMQALRELLPKEVNLQTGAGMADALITADGLAGEDGRILVFGSFFTVAAALR
jgi:dihydrofolate synthase / folylpolyglutamate synthase